LFEPAAENVQQNAPAGGTVRPSQSAADSLIMGGSGKGNMDEKQLRLLAENWGSMPAANRTKAIRDLTRDASPKYETMMRNYFTALDKMNGVQTQEQGGRP
jgi:hypothetical protein